MKTIVSFSTIYIFLVLCAYSQPAKLIAGPMLGYMEHREALIWMQAICCKKISIQYTAINQPKIKTELTQYNPNDSICDQPWIVKFIPNNLQSGTIFSYKIFLDGKEYKSSVPLKFKTKTVWENRTDPPDFSFVTGSCNYLNDSLTDKPGEPLGNGTEIFWRMSESKTDFMLWLGDNMYLREADYSSESGIKYRYQQTRSDKNLQKLLATKNNYAIWDDHDYADNNSGKGFELKQVSCNYFKNYWGNKTYGENNEGIYSKFSFSDADFILLDNRWWRDETSLSEIENPKKSQLGEQQLKWLFYQLAHSKATFKFVCVGGQFLNEYATDESFNLYKNEREQILDFIISNKISGVIFISGDRHFTELLQYNKRQTDLGYSLYELTSSPLSRKPYTDILNTSEKDNPMRIKNSLVNVNNFCTVSVSGKRGERVVTFACFDKDNNAQWEISLNEDQLKAKK